MIQLLGGIPFVEPVRNLAQILRSARVQCVPAISINISRETNSCARCLTWTVSTGLTVAVWSKFMDSVNDGAASRVILLL